MIGNLSRGSDLRGTNRQTDIVTLGLNWPWALDCLDEEEFGVVMVEMCRRMGLSEVLVCIGHRDKHLGDLACLHFFHASLTPVSR